MNLNPNTPLQRPYHHVVLETNDATTSLDVSRECNSMYARGYRLVASSCATRGRTVVTSMTFKLADA